MTDITTPLLLEIDGLCGCGFRIEQRADRGVLISLRSGGTEVVRSYEDVHPSHVDQFFEFAWSVALAIEADQEEGSVRDNFMDPSLHSEELGLEMRFDLVDDQNDHVRAELVLHSLAGMDSLDYCHIGVTVDLSLRQLVESTREAMGEQPSCN